ncbi:PiggyBac transposable element-derived protein 2 [Blattella germanica]|nr:PiggyBac transposable element-derived protein 2 [Blattella germanica]
MDLLTFRETVARDLLQKYGTPKLKPGPNVTSVDSRVSMEVRLDEKGHFIIPQEKRTRCALCKSHTTRKCIKCKVALHEKCFYDFHHKK